MARTPRFQREKNGSKPLQGIDGVRGEMVNARDCGSRYFAGSNPVVHPFFFE